MKKFMGTGVCALIALFHLQEESGALPALRGRAGNQRLIEDSTGKAFFMAGFAPQGIMCKSKGTIDSFFTARQSQGYNFAWIFAAPFFTNVDYYGNHMFFTDPGSWESSNINPAYMATLDYMVQSAENHGIYLFLDPDNDGSGGATPVAPHSLLECRHYGEFFGNRYKNSNNVNWTFASDNFVPDKNTEIALGIKGYMPNALYCIDWWDGSGFHQPYEAYTQNGCTWINVWGWYENYADAWTRTQTEYKRSIVRPVVIFEANYEQERSPITTPLDMRNQMYETVLGGGSGFGILGDKHWQDGVYEPLPGLSLHTPKCVNFFASRKWYELVPDANNSFKTASTRTACAARTADGTLGLSYSEGKSGGNTITIDMSKMSGQTTARWYDVASGQYTSIGTFANSGSRSFTTPSANSYGDWDWLLVLEGSITGLKTPGKAASMAMDCFPNPFKNTARIRYEGRGKGLLEFFDLRGSRLMSAAAGGEQLKAGIDLDTRTLSEGMYVVRLSLDGKRQGRVVAKVH
ncbi:MAG: DUF4038 domain-containing protein [Methanoregulaceae archaeon]|nr:DUF4038 domain-containing protein [Methanoregulaceae archaeon]